MALDDPWGSLTETIYHKLGLEPMCWDSNPCAGTQTHVLGLKPSCVGLEPQRPMQVQSTLQAEFPETSSLPRLLALAVGGCTSNTDIIHGFKSREKAAETRGVLRHCSTRRGQWNFHLHRSVYPLRKWGSFTG